MAKKYRGDNKSLSTDLAKLRLKMKDGVVEFEYLKKDGSVRTARGTLSKQIIPDYDASKYNRTRNYTVFPYYDVDKGEWRSFVRENFLGIIE